MSRKVAVIGMGHVGSTVAHYIVANGFADDLVLIDSNADKVNADALDFKDAMPNLPYHTNIIVNDYSALKDAEVIVSVVGNIKLQDQPQADRFVELPYTWKAVNDVAPKIKESGFSGKIVVISNPVDVITSLYQKLTGLPKNQVIGLMLIRAPLVDITLVSTVIHNLLPGQRSGFLINQLRSLPQNRILISKNWIRILSLVVGMSSKERNTLVTVSQLQLYV